MNKLRASIATFTSLLTIAATSATALAAGAAYMPPAPAPIQTPAATAKTVTTKSAAVQPTTCTTPATPDMTVTSSSENPIKEGPTGIWTIELYPGQDFGNWQVTWDSPSGATSYDFEVSDNSATDPTTGQFTSPITADHVSGNVNSSNDMQISIEETYYFHVKASALGCPGNYSPVEQINTTLIQPPSTLTSQNSDGTKGLQLLAVVTAFTAAFAFTKRSSLVDFARTTIQE